MTKNNNDLNRLYQYLDVIERKEHMEKIVNYDMETSAPKGGMEEDSEDLSSLQNDIYKIRKSQDFIMLVNKLYKVDYTHLNNYDKRLVYLLYQNQEKNRNVNEKVDKEANDTFNKAYITWLKAKKDKSYLEFAPTLKKIADTERQLILLREKHDPNDLYTTLIDDYEEGFTTKDLDSFFQELEDGIVPLYEKIRKSKYVPKHQFLTKKVPIEKQKEFTHYLLTLNGFDFERGSVSETEHPFTEQFSPDDVRVTTKYDENHFISNMYTVIHEGGHALFGQNLPSQVFTSHLGEGSLSMGKHESVSRFYENVIGRSKEYIHAIYPKFHELFKKELGKVTEKQLYEGVNYIDLNNPLRTEADELTYTLQIIIRYKLEKEMLEEKCDFKTLNQEFNKMMEQYLHIKVKNDAEGILQDVHWVDGFGYFPTYSIGNALNILYYEKMQKDFNVSKAVKEGKMNLILNWLKDNVFKTAALYDTKTWIKKITGKKFSATPYLNYLTKKYKEIYHIK